MKTYQFHIKTKLVRMCLFISYMTIPLLDEQAVFSISKHGQRFVSLLQFFSCSMKSTKLSQYFQAKVNWE